MKRILGVAVALVLTANVAFAGSSSITITAPQVTTLTLVDPAVYGSAATTFNNNAKSLINTQITSLVGTLQTKLNTDYFSKLHDLNQLSKGFANANAAAFDNASLLGFQTYDLFALMVGGNIGASLPTFDPNALGDTLSKITTDGDVYLGVATGGAAGQLGVNLGFLVPNLYLSGKFGMVPAVAYATSTSDGSGEVSFQQSMLGFGLNYTVLPQWDLLFGFIKWRGLSLGSGLTYNANTTKLTLAVKDQTSSQVVSLGGSAYGVADPTVTASVKNIKATLTVDNSSVVIPIEVMTSLQALWLFNVGLGAGVDVAFPTSRIKLAGSATTSVTGVTGATFSNGAVAVTATDSSASGDMFVPRLAASVGFNVAIIKFDIPVSYYPTTKALATGISAGIVW